MAGLSGLVVTLVSTVFARSSKDDQGFPDYNHLEYAKPMPAPDQQVPQLGPGSFHMEVGGKRAQAANVPMEEMPMPLRPAQNADNGEPPMDFIDGFAAPSSSAPAVSTTTATK